MKGTDLIDYVRQEAKNNKSHNVTELANWYNRTPMTIYGHVHNARKKHRESGGLYGANLVWCNGGLRLQGKLKELNNQSDTPDIKTFAIKQHKKTKGFLKSVMHQERLMAGLNPTDDVLIEFCKEQYGERLKVAHGRS